MTDEDRDEYRTAVEPWSKRAQRESAVITHVRWDRGHAEVTLEARKRDESVPSEARLI